MEQLRQYAPRVRAAGGGGLLTLSQASVEFGRHTVPAVVDGVTVRHLPWSRVLELLGGPLARVRGHERMWLGELSTYLQGVVRVRSVADSWVYCVVVNEERAGGGGARTFKQYVTDESNYFHPFGVSGWPKRPPNFLAFRWSGAVRRIHRVASVDVVASLRERWPDVPSTPDTERPHAVYELGKRLPPMDGIPSGASYRAARLWVLLDQLQTCSTLAEALAGTRSLVGAR